MADKPEVVKQANVAKFTKAALLNSKQFAGRKDLLNVVLKDGEQYTIEQAKNLMKSFLTKRVK